MAVSTNKLALGLRTIFFLHKLYNPKVKASKIEIQGNDPKEINKYNRDAPTHKQDLSSNQNLLLEHGYYLQR